jgi:hypothetical protein
MDCARAHVRCAISHGISHGISQSVWRPMLRQPGMGGCAHSAFTSPQPRNTRSSLQPPMVYPIRLRESLAATFPRSRRLPNGPGPDLSRRMSHAVSHAVSHAISRGLLRAVSRSEAVARETAAGLTPARQGRRGRRVGSATGPAPWSVAREGAEAEPTLRQRFSSRRLVITQQHGALTRSRSSLTRGSRRNQLRHWDLFSKMAASRFFLPTVYVGSTHTQRRIYVASMLSLRRLYVDSTCRLRSRSR